MTSVVGRLAGLLFLAMTMSVLYVHRDRVSAWGAQVMNSANSAGFHVSDMQKYAEGTVDSSANADATADEGRVRNKVWKMMRKARKCHRKCGSDADCHEHCPKPWKRFVKACNEFKDVKACNDQCASAPEKEVCKESCPKFAEPWLARKLAGFPEKTVEWVEKKCNKLQESVACHKACAHGDHSCHHNCPKVMKCHGWRHKMGSEGGDHDSHHEHHHHGHGWWHHGESEEDHDRREHADAEHHHGHGWHHHHDEDGDEDQKHHHGPHGWHEHGEHGWHHDHDHDDQKAVAYEEVEFDFFFKFSAAQENPAPKVGDFHV